MICSNRIIYFSLLSTFSTLVTHRNKYLANFLYFHTTEKVTRNVGTPKQSDGKILVMVPSDVPNILKRVDYKNILNISYQRSFFMHNIKKKKTFVTLEINESFFYLLLISLYPQITQRHF